jgi:catechol 2,3-dioxygenase-like lactoylglutathione lyase family enzyme
MRGIDHVTVGVADLDAALALWAGTFGLQVVARRPGPDPSLAALWGLDPSEIRGQAYLATPGADGGRLHLVEFPRGEAVRAGAAATDLCPKNLDVACADLFDRHRELAGAGYTFRSDPVEYPFEGSTVREVQMPGHDDTNIVFVEVVGQSPPLTHRGYGAVPAFVCVVGDPRAEAAFHTRGLGLDVVLAHRLDGPQIERMVGLPEGAGLHIGLFGDRANPYGRFEVVRYEGIDGEDRYRGARPPARGALAATLATGDLTADIGRLRAAGHEVTDHGRVEAVYGSGHVASTMSPAGLRVEILSRG